MDDKGFTIPGSLLQSAASTIVGAILGFLSTVAVFRSRFDVQDQKLVDLERLLEERRQHDRELVERSLAEVSRRVDESAKMSAEHYARIERHQRITLELVASLARRQGVTHRALGTDVVARVLRDEAEEDKTT